MFNEILDLLGEKWESKKLQEFLEKQKIKDPLIKEYSDVKYYEYKKHGFSICILKNSGKIDSIFCYNKGCYGFDKYSGPLPYNLSFDLFNSDIVSKFGEPDKKGGENMPVWISYESKGLQIDFINKIFEDNKNPISFFTFFK